MCKIYQDRSILNFPLDILLNQSLYYTFDHEQANTKICNNFKSSIQWLMQMVGLTTRVWIKSPKLPKWKPLVPMFPWYWDDVHAISLLLTTNPNERPKHYGNETKASPKDRLEFWRKLVPTGHRFLQTRLQGRRGVFLVSVGFVLVGWFAHTTPKKKPWKFKFRYMSVRHVLWSPQTHLKGM
jgi:hypothetical protein